MSYENHESNLGSNAFCTAVRLCTATKENQFTIDAQIRTRGEYRNGVLNPRPEGTSPTFFINERARLSLGYQRDRLQMKLAAQHVGVWGQDPQIDKTDGLFCTKLGHGLIFKRPVCAVGASATLV